MSIGITIDTGSLEALDARIRKLAHFELTTLLEGIGAELESQTRRRIEEEKTGPDGTPWKDWSESYASKKHGRRGHEPHQGELREADGHSLLRLNGDLLDSIAFEVDLWVHEVIWGSNLIYAAPNQATRPFLGISDSNRDDLQRIVDDFLGGLL